MIASLLFHFNPAVVIPLILLVACACLYRNRKAAKPALSVNYHFLRQCNYSCKFCFHTEKNRDVLDESKVKRGLSLLIEHGLGKINFSGGEPFLQAKLLGQMCRFVKQKSKGTVVVSIVSNGSKITHQWLEEHGRFVDYLAISCDSFDEATNQAIGRGAGQNYNQGSHLVKVAGWCAELDIKLKINTVVNSCNKDENMAERIEELGPCRWKVFQCLLIDGENAGEGALRDARSMCVTDQEFQAFMKRHENVTPRPIPEDNTTMRNSYLILDEKLRFLNSNHGKQPGSSLLDVGVAAAMHDCGFEEEPYQQRDGDYWQSTNSSVPDIEDLR
eukprot:m.207935 g.207935  ORF g.207935 m.207935 type:complete len:330 (+) comp18525_c0_seq1:285-1274(+)